MTTKQIEHSLFFYCEHHRNIVVNRVQPRYKFLTFENDFISLTRSGYATGFEIKISKGDLRKDLYKSHLSSVIKDSKKGLEKYYYRYKYFYYVVPKSLLEMAVKIIPEEFGILYCTEEGKDNDGRYLFYCHRPSSKLFNHKWNVEDLLHLAHLGCMRLHRTVTSVLEN